MVFSVNSANCNTLSQAFSSGKDEKVFKLGLIERILDFICGVDKKDALSLMNALGRQLKEFKDPKSTVLDKRDCRMCAEEFVGDLIRMVATNAEDEQIEFFKLMDSILALFAFDFQTSRDADEPLVSSGITVKTESARKTIPPYTCIRIQSSADFMRKPLVLFKPVELPPPLSSSPVLAIPVDTAYSTVDPSEHSDTALKEPVLAPAITVQPKEEASGALSVQPKTGDQAPESGVPVAIEVIPDDSVPGPIAKRDPVQQKGFFGDLYSMLTMCLG